MNKITTSFTKNIQEYLRYNSKNGIEDLIVNMFEITFIDTHKTIS